MIPVKPRGSFIPENERLRVHPWLLCPPRGVRARAHPGKGNSWAALHGERPLERANLPQEPGTPRSPGNVDDRAGELSAHPGRRVGTQT